MDEDLQGEIDSIMSYVRGGPKVSARPKVPQNPQIHSNLTDPNLMPMMGPSLPPSNDEDR
jgi:hypothetical protein